MKDWLKATWIPFAGWAFAYMCLGIGTLAFIIAWYMLASGAP